MRSQLATGELLAQGSREGWRLKKVIRVLKTLEMSSIVSNIYQFIGRRSSTWALVLITGGMSFEVIFDRGVEKIFDTVGKGVSLYESEIKITSCFLFHLHHILTIKCLHVKSSLRLLWQNPSMAKNSSECTEDGALTNFKFEGEMTSLSESSQGEVEDKPLWSYAAEI